MELNFTPKREGVSIEIVIAQFILSLVGGLISQNETNLSSQLGLVLITFSVYCIYLQNSNQIIPLMCV